MYLLLSLIPLSLFSEKVVLDRYFLSGASGGYGESAILNCDEVEETISEIKREKSRMEIGAKSGAIPYSGLLLPFYISENLEYQHLQEKLESLKNIEVEKCNGRKVGK